VKAAIKQAVGAEHVLEPAQKAVQADDPDVIHGLAPRQWPDPLGRDVYVLFTMPIYGLAAQWRCLAGRHI
jgi:hypothetical protein